MADFDGPEEYCRKNLLAIAQAYADAKDVSLAYVSRNFHGNTAFLAKYRDGECSIIVSTIQHMIAKFDGSWPRGTPWPGRGPFARPPKKRG